VRFFLKTLLNIWLQVHILKVVATIGQPDFHNHCVHLRHVHGTFEGIVWTNPPAHGYLSTVTRPSYMRRCGALIAAYALALQAMLSVFVLPVHALAPGFEICAGGANDDRARDPAAASCSACLAGHCAGAAASPGRIAVVEPWPRIAAGVPPAVRATALQPMPRHEPHSPRAPPLG
jgi:hypothetical protein